MVTVSPAARWEKVLARWAQARGFCVEDFEVLGKHEAGLLDSHGGPSVSVTARSNEGHAVRASIRGQHVLTAVVLGDTGEAFALAAALFEALR